MNKFFITLFLSLNLSLSVFAGVGGVSGGPSAAMPKYIQVESCGHFEDGNLCSKVMIRNRPDIENNGQVVQDCYEMKGELYVPCDAETQKEIPNLFKKLWNSSLKPYQNNSESGEDFVP